MRALCDGFDSGWRPDRQGPVRRDTRKVVDRRARSIIRRGLQTATLRIRGEGKKFKGQASSEGVNRALTAVLHALRRGRQ